MNVSKLMARFQSFKVTGQGLYFATFVAYLFVSFFRTTTYTDFISQNRLNQLSFAFVALLLCKIYFFDRQTIKTFLGISAVVVLGLLIWRKTHALDILMYLLLILGARGIKFAAINEWYLKLGTLLMVFTVCSTSLGIIKDLVFLRHGVSRHALGINYPTDLAAHVFFLILAYCYYRFGKLSWRDYSGFGVLTLVLYAVTQARLDCLLIIVVIPVMWLAQRASQGKLISRIIVSFYWIAPIVLGYITIVAAVFFNAKNHLFHLADKAVSGRLVLSHQALNQYGVPAFGNLVHEHAFGGTEGSKIFYASGMDGKYFYIDSSYMRLFIIYGLLALVTVLIIMTIISLHSIRVQSYLLAAIMLMVAVSCVIEQHLLDISFNPFLIALLADGAYQLRYRESTEVISWRNIHCKIWRDHL